MKLGFDITPAGPGIHFHVPGLPVTQGSKHAAVTKDGKPFMRESGGHRLGAWRTDVAVMGREVAADYRAKNGPKVLPFDGPVFLYVGFVLPRPKSRKRDLYPDTKPDLDKLVRAIKDALTGVLWVNDSRIVRSLQSKDFGEPGATIKVYRLPSRAGKGESREQGEMLL